jgi:hypothetical protein
MLKLWIAAIFTTTARASCDECYVYMNETWMSENNISHGNSIFLYDKCNADRCPVPGEPEPQFPLGARLAPDTVNADRSWVDKMTYADENLVSRTQCFTGAGNYARQQTYCDLECKESRDTRRAVAKASGRSDDGINEDCRGPWYCSKMEVCHLFSGKTVNDQDEDGPKRKCVTVRSCANHSQCFPNEADQERMRLDYPFFQYMTTSKLGTEIRDNGFKFRYGGMEHTTRCCVNRPNFRPTVDTPCNSAARARFFGVGALLVLAWR